MLRLTREVILTGILKLQFDGLFLPSIGRCFFTGPYYQQKTGNQARTVSGIRRREKDINGSSVRAGQLNSQYVET